MSNNGNASFTSPTTNIPSKITGKNTTIKTNLEIPHAALIQKKNNLNLNFKFMFSIFDNNKVNKKLYKVLKAFAGDYLLNGYVRYRGKPASEASMNNQYLIDSKLNIGYDSKKVVDEIEQII